MSTASITWYTGENPALPYYQHDVDDVSKEIWMLEWLNIGLATVETEEVPIFRLHVKQENYLEMCSKESVSYLLFINFMILIIY